MAEKITSDNQKCISECIVKHWSESSSTPPEQREEQYEHCLAECSICS